jgi:hypothetical protein
LRKYLWGLGLLVLVLPMRSQPLPCSGPTYRSFDFWLGDWDVFNANGNSKTAHVRVESVLGGCALREEYTATDGSTGESLSSWNAARHTWRQFWVSSKGAIVSIEGNVRDGAIVLTGTEQGTHAPDFVRGTWKPDAAGVRETAQRSQDNGRSWEAWFDLSFRRPVPSR